MSQQGLLSWNQSIAINKKKMTKPTSNFTNLTTTDLSGLSH
jgi:hypothetical protein